jgi:hypothetical protein
MNDYRAVRLFLKVGPFLALLAAALFWALAIWAAMQGLIGTLGIVVGFVAGAVVGFLVMVLVDLTRLIAEMLIPR